MTNDQYWHTHKAATELASGSFGGFAESLGKAMFRADMANLERIAEAFPDLIALAHERIAEREARQAIATAQG